MNYRVVLAYDGTNYQGWQKQGEKPTIQLAISRALEKISGSPVSVHGAGRTDSGVHAAGQVASFHLHQDWEGWRLCSALNGNLPADIRVLKAESVPDEFHARRSAIGKKYCYQLDTGAIHQPLLFRYAWHYPWPLDLELLERNGSLLQGTHDFTAFTVADCEVKTRIRTIHHVGLETVGDLLRIHFEGEGFLRYQVRKMVSTLLALNRRGMQPQSYAAMISLCELTRGNKLAPAKGLTLVKVEY